MIEGLLRCLGFGLLPGVFGHVRHIAELKPRKPGIKAAARDEIRMLAFFLQFAVFEDINPIRVLHGCEPMGNDKGGASGFQTG